jgi:hypothetical protein
MLLLLLLLNLVGVIQHMLAIADTAVAAATPMPRQGHCPEVTGCTNSSSMLVP